MDEYGDDVTIQNFPKNSIVKLIENAAEFSIFNNSMSSSAT